MDLSIVLYVAAQHAAHAAESLPSLEALPTPEGTDPTGGVATFLLSFLQTGGGWALSIILGWVIWKLAKKIEALQERIFGLLDRQSEILGALSAIKKGEG